MTLNVPRLLVILPTVLCLTGCYVPNAYRATITLSRDGTYTAAYEGEVTGEEELAALKGKKGAALKDADRKISADLERRKGAIGEGAIKSLSYLGNGRYTAAARTGGSLPLDRQGTSIYNVVQVSTDDGVTTLSTPAALRLDAARRAKGAPPSKGEVCIKSELLVIAHNADQVPTSPDGCYTWKIDAAAMKKDLVLKVRRVTPPSDETASPAVQ